MRNKRKADSTGVRIIGGEWRGRRLGIPAGTTVRPTPDRVRETLFNWLAARLPGARCLDLFAGTGVLGLEALSRGAGEAWFVERDAVLVRTLQRHIQELGANARTLRGEAMDVLGTPPPKVFDVVFADPPYAMNLADVLVNLSSWLAPEHWVYVERPVERGGDALGKVVAAVPGARVVKHGRAARVAYGLIRLAVRE